ncbi:MAG: plasma membrane fusion protein prm1 [Cirrosporium novae-zelandiae]|nr:MAG: plasma membrane fusion protein prm1 [Cirrosporium novae-zelandiae]
MSPLDGIRRLLFSTTEMSATRDPPHPPTFPAIPPSLSAGDQGARDYYAENAAPRTTPNTAPSITPYLGLRSRLSQVWINRWTILLLLVLARTLLAISGLNNDLASAKREALSACTSVEDVGSTMASMPHYMADGVNALTAKGIEKGANGLMSMLLLTVTGVEEIAIFVINMMTQTYVCLITLAITGSLHVALKVVEDATSFLNKTLGDIGTDIHDSVNTFQTDLNKFVDALNSVPEVFGSSASIPELNINSSLNALDTLSLPSSLNEGLGDLNSSIPTFDQVNNFTQDALRFPFEAVKTLINESMVKYTFDDSVLPVPQKEQLTFCSDNNAISNFFDELANLIYLFHKIFIIVLVILAVLVCIPMAYREIRRWRMIQQRARLVEQNQFDSLDVIYIASRPYTSHAGMKVASKMSTPKRKTLARWVVAYATSLPALFVLSLGIAGLFACLCQYILLKGIEKEVPALTSEVGDFADKVVNALNNASEQWAVGTNKVIASTNSDINNNVFGWVNTTTTAINDTLNTFVDDMTDALNITFGDTILYDPILEVLNCLILLKIKGIEKGLTWVSDNAQVNFPTLPNNTFSIGALSSLDGDDSSADALLADPTGEATDKITATVTRVVDNLTNAIRTEAIISSCLVLAWVIMVILGILRACWLSTRRDKTRGEGGPSYVMNDMHPQGHGVAVERAFSPSPRYSQAIASDKPRVGVHSDYFPGAEVIDDDEDIWQDQKLGFAGQRNDATQRSGHERVSSHGELGGWEKH